MCHTFVSIQLVSTSRAYQIRAGTQIQTIKIRLGELLFSNLHQPAIDNVGIVQLDRNFFKDCIGADIVLFKAIKPKRRLLSG